MRTWRIADLLEVSAGFLRERGSSSPRLDAELLLAEALGVGRIDLYTQYDRPLGVDEVDAYRALVARRGKREPVAYILGRAAFRYLTLKVTPATLIPRPETEELVDAVLEWLRVHPVLEAEAPAQPPVGSGPVPAAAPEPPAASEPFAAPAAPAVHAAPAVVDVGTGSGAIALSLAGEGGVRVLGIDVSEAALRVAEENRAALGLDSQVELHAGDLLEGVAPGSMRVVVANLPYVTDGERGSLEPDVRDFEPVSALFAGVDGLDQIRRLVPQAAAALGPGGALFLEVGAGQAEEVRVLAAAAGFEQIAIIPDLSGKDRIVRAALPGCPVVDISAVDETTLERLRAGLRAGAIVALPTDTVYGLASFWDCPQGVARLFEAKGRDEERPVAVLFASVERVRESLPDVEAAAASVLEHLLPGPYTFVVGTDVQRPRLVGTADSLGVRVPDHAPLLRLLEALGTPLAATSANRSGAPDAAEAADVDPGLLTMCAAAFAGAAATGGVPSTVVDLRPLATGADALVLREGAVPAEEVLRLVAKALAAAAERKQDVEGGE
ncbi:MAG: L-threonylcarbamoyladenylate synthase [Thermoleophilia bacterium]